MPNLYRTPTVHETNMETYNRAAAFRVRLEWRCVACGKRYRVEIPEERQHDAEAFRVSSPCCARPMEIG